MSERGSAGMEEQPVAVGLTGTSFLLNWKVSRSRIEEPVIFLDLALSSEDGSRLAGTRYIFSQTKNLATLLDVAPTRLEVGTVAARERWEVQVTNPGDSAALFIWLQAGREVREPGYAYFDRNHFCLFPGESQLVAVEWSEIPPGERRLIVCGWNTPVVSETLSGSGRVER